MTAWARTSEGWAMNLDGSDGALVFSLPRVELRSSARGWRGLCFLADGTCREWDCGFADSLMSAKALSADRAQECVGAPRAVRQDQPTMPDGERE